MLIHVLVTRPSIPVPIIQTPCLTLFKNLSSAFQKSSNNAAHTRMPAIKILSIILQTLKSLIFSLCKKTKTRRWKFPKNFNVGFIHKFLYG